MNNTKKYKIVINADFGGFGLSRAAIEWLAKRGIFLKYQNLEFIEDIPRHEPLLVECVETLRGSKRNVRRFANCGNRNTRIFNFRLRRKRKRYHPAIGFYFHPRKQRITMKTPKRKYSFPIDSFNYPGMRNAFEGEDVPSAHARQCERWKRKNRVAQLKRTIARLTQELRYEREYSSSFLAAYNRLARTFRNAKQENLACTDAEQLTGRKEEA